MNNEDGDCTIENHVRHNEIEYMHSFPNHFQVMLAVDLAKNSRLFDMKCSDSKMNYS